ncbi:XRE family transcriptional regulator [Marinobacter sp. KMM 10035]|uniref:XRE family transcriptional regulator n=1 Tax=Marinobacter sp. KMM 10035 TaxID=3134034 RepID=UPI00397A16ED
MYTLASSQAEIDTKSVVAGLDTLRTIHVMEKWFDRVRSLMRRDGVTQDALTEVLGVKTRGAVGHYLSGRREPSIDQLRALATLFNVSLDWILTGQGEVGERPPPHLVLEDVDQYPRRWGVTSEWKSRVERAQKELAPPPQEDELEFVGHMDAWDSKTPLDDDEVELPLFREVELAAGAGQTEVIENHGAKLRFAKSTLARAGVLKENAACAFVRGNSMEPVMPDGTCVGVNTGDTTIRDGEIYAIDHGGMLRVKYLHRRPGGGIKIVSQNAVEHPVEDVTADEMAASVRVIGRVFWWSVLR